MELHSPSHAGDLLALSGAYWHSFTLHTAVAWGVFSAISDQCLPAAEISQRCGTEPDATQRLLQALTAMELVEARAEGYRNTPLAATYLDATSKHYLGHMIQHHRDLAFAWLRLPEAIQHGGNILERPPFKDENTTLEAFLWGMHNNAMLQAPQLAHHLQPYLQQCRFLLDLGGGPGTYAITFCRQQPELRATVFDLPGAQPYAQRNIEDHGLGERIGFISGDFQQEALPGKYDMVWLSHILHGMGAESCQQVVNKAAAALEPEGILLIHEFVLNNDKQAPLFPALFSLNMLVATEEGRAYSEAELRAMLTTAGLKQVQRLDYEGPQGTALLSGRR